METDADSPLETPRFASSFSGALLGFLAGRGGMRFRSRAPSFTRASTPGVLRCFRRGRLIRATACPTDTLRWWKDFRDPALDSLVSLTLGENFDLMAAWARFRQSVAAAEKAGAARFPQLEVNADGSKSKRYLNLGIPDAP